MSFSLRLALEPNFMIKILYSSSVLQIGLSPKSAKDSVLSKLSHENWVAVYSKSLPKSIYIPDKSFNSRISPTAKEHANKTSKWITILEQSGISKWIRDTPSSGHTHLLN